MMLRPTISEKVMICARDKEALETAGIVVLMLCGIVARIMHEEIMDRRNFCKTLAAVPAALRGPPAATPSNILYILSDDLRSGRLGCSNKDTAPPTPPPNRFPTGDPPVTGH